MQLQFFFVPVQEHAPATSELNRFLGTHRVLSMDRELVHDGANSFWSICVRFVAAGSAADGNVPPGEVDRIDYRDVLSEPDFALYAEMRTFRNQLAKSRGVPPYAVLNNEQLATIVRGRLTTVADVAKIQGVGEARAEKYGAEILKKLHELAGVGTDGDKRPASEPQEGDNPPTPSPKPASLFEKTDP